MTRVGYLRDHPEKRVHWQEYQRRYHLEHPEANKENHRRYYQKHHDEVRVRQHKYNVKTYKMIKEKIFNILGNSCYNPDCPIPKDKVDIRALQIDHVYGNGNQIRSILNSSSSIQYYKKILKELEGGSKEYQVLCVYCNWLKSFTNGER